MFKKKILLTWKQFGIIGKIALILALAVAIFIVVSNIVIFDTYHNQLNETMISQAKQDIYLNALGIQRRTESAVSTASNLSLLVKFIHDKPDFEQILVPNLKLEMEYHSLPKQIAYYSFETNEFIAVNRDGSAGNEISHEERIPLLREAKEGTVIVFRVDRNTGDVSTGAPVYDEEGNLIGGIIITGNLAQIFQEIESTELRAPAIRAVAQKNGDYIWKHKNYNSRYPNGTNILKDFPSLPKDFLENDSDAAILEGSVVSFITVKVPGSEYVAVFFQEQEVDTFIAATEALKSTFWGLGLGFLGVTGLVFIYIARLIGVQIKLGEMEIKEEHASLLSDEKKEELLEKLNKQR